MCIYRYMCVTHIYACLGSKWPLIMKTSQYHRLRCSFSNYTIQSHLQLCCCCCLNVVNQLKTLSFPGHFYLERRARSYQKYSGWVHIIMFPPVCFFIKWHVVKRFTLFLIHIVKTLVREDSKTDSESKKNDRIGTLPIRRDKVRVLIAMCLLQ